MSTETLVDHARGLCGKPDIQTMDLAVAIVTPPHCLCCGAAMLVHDDLSLSLQQLGMFTVTCPDCPAS